jgi:2-hydroxychromene-2-carboxylate isomerase
MSTSPGAVIEVFADIWCPFAHVGLRAVEEQRALSGRVDVAIRVRAWPLELVNGTPLDPLVTKEHADHLREQVVPNLFADLDVDHFPSSTLDALALANRAYRTDLQVGERMSFALRDALFEEGRDLSDRAVLEDVAVALGVGVPDDSDTAAVLFLRGRRHVLPVARLHQGSETGRVDRQGRVPAGGVPGRVPRAAPVAVEASCAAPEVLKRLLHPRPRPWGMHTSDVHRGPLRRSGNPEVLLRVSTATGRHGVRQAIASAAIESPSCAACFRAPQ